MTETLGPCHIYLGDCYELKDKISADALLTDPPYGCSNNCDYSRFSGGLSPSRNFHEGIVGDDQPFDPRPWLNYQHVVLFGYQFFAQQLPLGTVLIWNKKRPNQLGTFLSDAELAWSKGGKGVYLFSHVWHGFDRQSERGRTLHPTQKPVALWEWVLDRLKLQPGQVVFDPFMGSGPLAVACVRRGLTYHGCEVNKTYYDVARERIRNELAVLN